MRDDKTPTVTSRRRKPTPHQRLRLDKAKELKKLGALTKKNREVKKQKPGETDPAKMVMLAPRLPKLRKDTLSKPAKPPAKFRKRQIHKAWLPTHLYHAKRAHMTPPKEPLWRFAIPLTPTDKCYRPTHRAASARGCVAWDMSYMSTIGVEGVEDSLLGLLRGVGVEESVLVGRREGKWRRGTRGWEGWIRERDGGKRWIAWVGIIWCPLAAHSEEEKPTVEKVKDATTAGANEEEKVKDAATTGADEDENVVQGGAKAAQEDVAVEDVGAVLKQVAKQEKKKARRRLLIRVHPSAFLQVWNEILKIAKIQRPPAMVEDLRFEIGSLEVVGPESTEALIGALHPIKEAETGTEEKPRTSADDGWEDIETPAKVWPQLASVTNPASLPANALLGFNISDPRLHHPPRTLKKSELSGDPLLEVLTSWPADQTQNVSDIFDRAKRLIASRSLASQKAINRRKGDALPGAYPEPSLKDPKIPVLLMASRTSTANGQGSWKLLLPWDCVLPVWYSLMHYPLSSGGNPRFGGLQEKRQVSFEHAMLWFPGDYPGTKAGFEWELLEREKKRREWEKRPKGKRTEWGSVDLGDGKRGEIGMGWACDWERLFQGPQPPSPDDLDTSTAKEPDKAANSKPQQSPSSASQPSQPATEPPDPPLQIHHLTNPLSNTALVLPTALIPIDLILLSTGHPTRNARIYRLPTTNNELRAQWLALAHPPKAGKKEKARPPRSMPVAKNAPEHVRNQHLAKSLLESSILSLQTEPPKAGDPTYPHVPDESDLIGFVTTGNYHLGEGKCEAIGNIAVARVMGDEAKKRTASERNLCIVREAGQSLGRLARWRFI